MAPFYKHCSSLLKTPVDALLLSQLEEKNKSTLKQLDEKLKDAQENLGETEISDALIAKALHFTKIGEKVSKTLVIYRKLRLKLMNKLWKRLLQLV